MQERIKVTSCSDFMYWYKADIGAKFNVLHKDEECYWVVASDGFINFILKKDAEVV